MALPKSLTTATPLSKTLAMILFITLPFLGVYLGMQYQEVIDFQNIQTVNTSPSAKPHPAPSNVPTANWKTINYPEQGFSFQYPPDKLFLDYPENCFREMQDYQALFVVIFHLRKHPQDWVNSDQYKNCIGLGEDGSEFEVAVYPKKVCTEPRPSLEEKSKRMTVAGQDATLIYNRGRFGGTGNSIICFTNNNFTYNILIPSESSRPEDKIDPLFNQILSTFTFLD